VDHQRRNVNELRDELQRYERELYAARKAERTVRTYVDNSARFLRFLEGDYIPSEGRRPRARRRDP
jgi:hypothetical protein